MKLIDKMCKYEIDPASIVEETERTRFCTQKDRRTGGQGGQLRWSGGYKNVCWNRTDLLGTTPPNVHLYWMTAKMCVPKFQIWTEIVHVQYYQGLHDALMHTKVFKAYIYIYMYMYVGIFIYLCHFSISLLTQRCNCGNKQWREVQVLIKIKLCGQFEFCFE